MSQAGNVVLDHNRCLGQECVPQSRMIAFGAKALTSKPNDLNEIPVTQCSRRELTPTAVL